MNMQNLAESIRKNDLEEYQALRYPEISDGDPIAIHNEDFSNVDFGKFVLGFFEFNNCTLDRASAFYGQPITLRDCSARSIDMRGVSAIIKASGCDFTGMKYDKATELAYGKDDSSARSEFIDCILDDEAKDYFLVQGVRFR